MKISYRLARSYFRGRKGLKTIILGSACMSGVWVVSHLPNINELSVWSRKDLQSEEDESFIYLGYANNLGPGQIYDRIEAPLLPSLLHLIDFKKTDVQALQLALDCKIAAKFSKHNFSKAVNRLAAEQKLSDWECLQVAQAIDWRTAVALARTQNSDLRFFLKPPAFDNLHKKSILDDLHGLLRKLPTYNDDSCADYSTKLALALTTLKLDHHGIDPMMVATWNPDSLDLSYRELKKFGSSALIISCLDAIIAHSTELKSCKVFVSRGGLQVLERILSDKDLVKIRSEFESRVVQILAHISVHDAFQREIFQSGFVGLLAAWVRSTNPQLCYPAVRALANLDRDQTDAISYQEGVYLLYPQNRQRRVHKVDVIFVHGLLGGALWTWRQAVPASSNGGIVECNSSNELCERTFCWPKDWLAQDVSNLRVLAIDFRTHLSGWNMKCPEEQEKQTLLLRSERLLHKLRSAGIGDRPLVWVTHSMGGLLVKQLLLMAETRPDTRSMVDNTRGVVFLSVPHRGSSVADLNKAIQLLLMPSLEVRELKKDSVFLLNLHAKFSELVDRRKIACLSFGETMKTKVKKLGGLSVRLVTIDSSDPGFGEFYTVDQDHIHVCKPESKDSFVYAKLVEFIKRNI